MGVLAPAVSVFSGIIRLSNICVSRKATNKLIGILAIMHTAVAMRPPDRNVRSIHNPANSAAMANTAIRHPIDNAKPTDA